MEYMGLSGLNGKEVEVLRWVSYTSVLDTEDIQEEEWGGLRREMFRLRCYSDPKIEQFGGNCVCRTSRRY